MKLSERKLKRIIRNMISESNSNSSAYNQLASCIEQGLLDAGVIGYPLKDLSYEQSQKVNSAIEDAIAILMSLDGHL